METRSSERDQYKEFTENQVRDMDLNKYNGHLTSGRWSNKYPNDDHILALVGVTQNTADDFNK